MSTSSWPNNKKFALCLTHDVDRIEKSWWHCIYYFIKTKKLYHLKSLFSRYYENPYWNFEKIMRIEEKLGVRSTFFFLNESKKFNIFDIGSYKLTLGNYKINDKRIINIIKKLDNEGWEIALHGSYDSYKNSSLLKIEKKELEDILGKPIIGIRQHYLNLQIPFTWFIQEKNGFKYDASFGFTNRIGYRDKKMLPFSPRDSKILVIPLTIMDGALYKYNEKDIWKYCLEIIDFCEINNLLLTILWHTEKFNVNESSKHSIIYKNIIKECKKRDAWIARCIDIYEWCSK